MPLTVAYLLTGDTPPHILSDSGDTHSNSSVRYKPGKKREKESRKAMDTQNKHTPKTNKNIINSF